MWMKNFTTAWSTAFSGTVPFISDGDIPLDRDGPKLYHEYCHILSNYTASGIK